MKSFAVIGLGRFGRYIAEQLYGSGKDVLAIDCHEDKVNEIANNVTRAVIADTTEAQVLKNLGVQNCDCVIVAIGENLSASVLTTLNLVNLGVKNLVCKASDATHSEILTKLGASKVIIPEQAIAEKIAASLISPNILEEIELSRDYGIIESKPPKSWINKSIKDLNIRAKLGINIIAVKQGEKITVSPNADYVITPDDTLVLLGEYRNLGKLQ